jgi:hypothetical protein
MKRYLPVAFLSLVMGFGGGFVAGGFSESEARGEAKSDEFEVFLVPNARVISVSPDPQAFFVVLKNKSKEPKRLFEFWNSWGYQNISFHVHTADGVRVLTRKDQDFTRNFPSTYEVLGGEVTVFRISFDERWDELSAIADGESKVRMQVVYKCDPSPEAEEERAWTGTVASKVYDVTFWRAPVPSGGQ